MNEILNIVGGLLKSDKFFDLFKGKERRLLDFQMELQKELNKQNLAQMEVNKQEAKHKSIFVAGWRPAIGWICGGAIAYSYILQPFLLLAIKLFDYTFELPTLDLSQLIPLLTAMLGMSGLRTFEKLKNKAK